MKILLSKPLIAVYIAGTLAMCALTVFGQTESITTARVIETVFVVGAGVVTLLNIFWSYRNKRTSGTIEELTKLVEVKDKRNEDLKLQKSELESRLKLKISGLENDLKESHVNNKSVTKINLLAVGQLRQLRLEGKWDGHEDSIFEVHKTDA